MGIYRKLWTQPFKNHWLLFEKRNAFDTKVPWQFESDGIEDLSNM